MFRSGHLTDPPLDGLPVHPDSPAPAHVGTVSMYLVALPMNCWKPVTYHFLGYLVTS
jgi:hypothetical protein